MSYLLDILDNNKLRRPEYINDTERIFKLCRQKGFIVTLKQAEEIWQAYSDDMAAGWLILPKDDEELWIIIGK